MNGSSTLLLRPRHSTVQLLRLGLIVFVLFWHSARASEAKPASQPLPQALEPTASPAPSDETMPVAASELPREVQDACAARAYVPEQAERCIAAFADWKEAYCSSIDADPWTASFGPTAIFRAAFAMREQCDVDRVCPLPEEPPRTP